MRHVVVAEDVFLALALAHAVDHTRVIVLIGKQNHVRDNFSEHLQCRFVRDEAGGAHQRAFLLVKQGELGLQINVISGGPADVARPAGTHA